ncbi:MAG: hypothetical protein ACFFCW_34115 [Candidatus Hodarchaeota archaeon]
MDGRLIDSLVVLFALIYNINLIIVFVLRAHERERLEWKFGYVFNGLLIPFTVLWLFNLLIGSDIGRLITGMPVILFIVYDLWYRTLTKKKPTHHPDRWPLGLKVYLFLFQIGSILLNGYAFLVSLLYGYIVLVSWFCVLAAFGYYQYTYNKKKRASENWIE